MPARDILHEDLKAALIKDGWAITHDPLVLKWGSKDLYVDIGAEQLLAAEKGHTKIAVEVKSFVGPSDVAELEQALGQYILYHDVLAEREPDRTLYLAVPEFIVRDVFDEPIGQLLLKNQRLRIVVFDAVQQVVLKWIL